MKILRTFSASVEKTMRLLPLVLALAVCVWADTKSAQLPQQYRDWLQHDVLYIINNDEREVFLNLASDKDRDAFIERFWDVRNPAPGAPTNAFKEEHYRRIQYANQYFGKEGAVEGWRSDRGRIYILLGPPKQNNRLISLDKVWPMEIWFYSNGNPALPPHFYIVFYQKEGHGEFKLYSPVMDGPDKLVVAFGENNRIRAYQLIKETAGAEVARNSLTLTTDEPIDSATATSSLQSDMMLSTIKNLPNHPLSKEMLRQRQQNLEAVTTRIVLGDQFLKVLTLPLRDSEGNINLHYVLSLNKPADFAIGKRSDGKFYYGVNTEIAVSDADGKIVFTQNRTLSQFLSADDVEAAKGKLFGIEGWLPIAPGKYKMRFLLTNKTTNTAFRAEREAVVPSIPEQGLRITDVVAFTDAVPVGAKSAYLPFSSAGVKFTPLAAEEMSLAPGQELKFFYQVWSAGEADKGILNANYAYGRPGSPGDAKKIQEQFSREQFDESGSMINGKKVPTVDLIPGNYRLSVTVSDPASQQKAFAGSAFRIVSDGALPALWRVYDQSVTEDIAKGTIDFQRGLAYQAQGDNEKALTFFQRAAQKNPENEQARSRLVDNYFSRQAYPEIVKLFATTPPSKSSDEATILRYAESLYKTGQLQRAISVLETALQQNTASRPMFVTLAGYYKQAGDPAKAGDLLRRSENLAVVQ